MSDPTGKSSHKTSEVSSDEDPSFKKSPNRKRKKKTLKKKTHKKINDNKTPENEINQPHLAPHSDTEVNDMMEIDDSIKITSQSIQKAGTSAEFPNIQITQQSKMVNNQQINRTRNNFSETMKDIINKKYNSLYYMNTDTNINTRIQMADIWENERPQNKDTILKTKKGFLLKTDTPKVIIEETLKKMKNSKKINEYSTATPYIQRNKERSLPLPNYSCVIARVEKEINDEELNNHLKKANYEFRYCKRIISKQTNTPTSLIRIITGNINTYEEILSEGVFYKADIIQHTQAMLQIQHRSLAANACSTHTAPKIAPNPPNV